jgi:hypothetical protein
VSQVQQLPQLALLERVVAVLKDDPYVRAAFLRGSFYSGRPDEYSDLDVFAVVEPIDIEPFCAQARSMLAHADHVLSLSRIVATPMHLRVLFPGPLRLDLFIVTPETLPLYVGWRVLFDDHDLLNRRPRRAEMRGALLPEHVVALCDEFWWNIFMSISWLKRGHIWMALRTLDSARVGLTQLMRWRRDPAHPYEHFVDLERHLTAEDQQALAQTLAAYELRSVVMALLAAADAFDPAAREVAARLGVEYPAELAQTVKHFFIREFWALIAPGPTISA